MTRPPARPKPGRYWVVEDDEPFVWSAFDNREHAALDAARLGAHVVECVPMPRVTVTKDYGSPSVRVNGVCVRSFHDLRLARSWATNLRRALRGK